MLFGSLPRTIFIQGQRWTIREESKEHATRKSSLTAKGLYGVTMPAARTITLRYGLSPEHRDQTILHELLHACYTATGDDLLGHSLEEKIVALLETPLWECLTQLLEKK